jgi:DNA polymerase-4
MTCLCRDCLEVFDSGDGRCRICGSPRLFQHPELSQLSIAHIDCDAFYASVEKRDNPELRDKPVIVGGGRRGVVSAACYVARRSGVHSAMPMFKARKLCPDAVIIRPDMDKYGQVGGKVREIMREYTPLVEPLSLDEAFLDLGGTEKLHHGPPARTLALIVRRIEDEIGVTASIGLSYNKFLAKVASDLDKPRGFAALGRAQAVEFLSHQPVTIIWGAGKAFQRRLSRDGITTVSQIQALSEKELIKRYGAMGHRMAAFVHGRDSRKVNPAAAVKSVSSETTFDTDIVDHEELARILWRQAERVSRRLKAKGRSGGTVVLKLRTADFRIITRSRRLPAPTQLADVIYRVAETLLRIETGVLAYRLLGVGVTQIGGETEADPYDLADPDAEKRADAERAVDKVQARFGKNVISKGRGFNPPAGNRK